MDHKESFANAELLRRFNNLFVDSEITAIDKNKGVIDVTIITPDGDCIIKNITLMNVAIEQVSEGQPVLLMNPQGSPEAGMAFVLGPDPEQKAQNERIDALEMQVNDLRQQLSSLYNNNS